MPLEIKELTIQVNISQEQTVPTGAGISNSASPDIGGNDSGNLDNLTQEIIEKVLEILKSKAER